MKEGKEGKGGPAGRGGGGEDLKMQRDNAFALSLHWCAPHGRSLQGESPEGRVRSPSL